MNHCGDLPSLARVRDGAVVRGWPTLVRWLLMAASAYGAAMAASAAVAWWLAPDDAPAVTAASNHEERVHAPARAYRISLERNLFGGAPAAPAGDTAPATANASAETFRLRGTARVDDHAYAVIEDVDGGRQEVFAVGETVFDGPKLVAVEPGKAVLARGARKTTLVLREDESPPSEPRRQQSASGAAARGRSGIRKTGENTYLVDRREVEHSIENLSKIATQMRAVPYMRDGQTVGFRVFNIRPGSVFDRMGLKNGDVVQRVNGVELDSPTKALALLQDVQTTDEIRVDLLRDERPSTLTYTVR